MDLQKICYYIQIQHYGIKNIAKKIIQIQRHGIKNIEKNN